VTTYFTRATAAVSVAVGNVSGDSGHIIPLNIHKSPVNITYYVTLASGSGEVSANAYWTIDPPLQVATPVWFLDKNFTLAGGIGVSARNITFPIAGFMFTVNASGSANYALGLLQPGM